MTSVRLLSSTVVATLSAQNIDPMTTSQYACVKFVDNLEGTLTNGSKGRNQPQPG